MLFGLNHGELFVVAFITIAVVSATLWPKLGALVARKLTGQGSPDPEPEPPNHSDN